MAAVMPPSSPDSSVEHPTKPVAMIALKTQRRIGMRLDRLTAIRDENADDFSKPHDFAILPTRGCHASPVEPEPSPPSVPEPSVPEPSVPELSPSPPEDESSPDSELPLLPVGASSSSSPSSSSPHCGR